jgi:diguanylate cyclase (GGDEF)-like protein
VAGRGRLRALNIQEERVLAGRVAGLMYVVGAATGALLLLLPGVPTEHWRVTVAASFLALVWGWLLLAVIDWKRVLPAVSHFSCGLGYPLVAILAATTGGLHSPAEFFLFVTIFYVAYFYPLREALPHLFACLAVEMLPFLYDPRAVSEGLIGEVMVLAAVYAILGGLIYSGKQLLVQLRDAERELSRRDSLTELANRRALMTLLNEQTPGERAADALGLVLVDLDHFKTANTIYGHPGGDRVLCEAARALTAAARDGDLVARLGGDEFAIACSGMTEEGLAELGERVLAALHDANGRLDMPEFRLGASVGSALFPADAASPEGLIGRRPSHARCQVRRAQPRRRRLTASVAFRKAYFCALGEHHPEEKS